MKGWLLTAALLLAVLPARAQEPDSQHQHLISRAKALELSTTYIPPPRGSPLEYFAAGYAKVICSAVFITGLQPEFAAENVGFFTAPYDKRAKVGKPIVDRVRRSVEIRAPNGVHRKALFLEDQGCVTLPKGQQTVSFTPVRVRSGLPDPSTRPWPMGDAVSAEPPPSGLDTSKVSQAVNAAFEPSTGMTAAFVVTWKGRIIGERYGPGITATTPLESWSMGKSVTATLMGILIRDGVYKLSQPAPIPEWQKPGDPRAKIRISDLMQMSSGLRSRAPQDPDFDPSGPYPDHLYLYTGGVNSFRYAATRPLQWPRAR
jgi:Beta-lactamase